MEKYKEENGGLVYIHQANITLTHFKNTNKTTKYNKNSIGHHGSSVFHSCLRLTLAWVESGYVDDDQIWTMLTCCILRFYCSVQCECLKYVWILLR